MSKLGDKEIFRHFFSVNQKVKISFLIVKNISVLYLSVSTTLQYLFPALQTQGICETPPFVAR